MASLEGIASVLGVSVPVTRFLLCFLGSIPCSAVARLMPAGRVRNLYAAATGIVLSYYSFGPEANLFFILPIVVGYGSMLLARRHCAAITFSVAFGFLLIWYVRFVCLIGCWLVECGFPCCLRDYVSYIRYGSFESWFVVRVIRFTYSKWTG